MSNADTVKKIKIGQFVLLQLLVMTFSQVSVQLKFASNQFAVTNSWLSFPVLLHLIIALLVCGIYAIGWQITLKHIPLNIAYVNRGSEMLWAALWSYIFFSQSMTLFNFIGIVLIIVGITVVLYDK